MTVQFEMKLDENICGCTLYSYFNVLFSRFLLQPRSPSQSPSRTVHSICFAGIEEIKSRNDHTKYLFKYEMACLMFKSNARVVAEIHSATDEDEDEVEELKN